MTLQGALRYDHAWSYYPAQQLGPTRLPADAADVPRNAGRHRLQRHRPAVRRGVRPVRQREDGDQVQCRAGISRWPWPATGTTRRSCPSSRIPTSVDANVDRRQPELHARLQPAESRLSERRVRADQQPELREERQQRCRTTRTSCRAGTTGRRDWIIGATVQHELLPRVSVSVGYTRRWLQQLHGHRQPADERRRTSRRSASRRRSIRGCLAAAATRSPGCTTSSRPSSARSTTTRPTRRPTGTISQMYNGVDVNVNARIRQGFQVQGGLSTGQRVTDYCSIRAAAAGDDRRVLDRQRGAGSSARRIRTATTRRGSRRGTPRPVRTRFRRSTCCSAPC